MDLQKLWAEQREETSCHQCVCVCVCVYTHTQSCLTLCDPMNCSPPGSSVHGISQVKILEGVAISYSWWSSRPRNRTCISCIGRWILHHHATWEAHATRPPPFPLRQMQRRTRLPRWLSDRESACNTGDVGWIPGSGRSSGEGNGNPLHYSYLENLIVRDAWLATVHGVTKGSDTT